MTFGAQFASVAFAVIVFLVVFEMVRRRRLGERYALLWLGAAVALLVLAAWTQLLKAISSAVGIATPSNTFFVIAFAFLLLLLLHCSAVLSRLSDETRVLAQRLALVEQRLRAEEEATGHENGDQELADASRAPARRARAGSKS